MDKAYAEEFSFLQKRSPTLLGDLRNWLIDQVGFGDFIFRLPDRKTEVARASNLNELEKALHTVPSESISYHAGRNHFSHWLMARTEFAVAQKLRPRKVSDFASIEVLRRDLIDAITSYRREQSHTLVADFNSDIFQPDDSYFLRIGDGSLGGKARGLAFARHLLHPTHMPERIPGLRIVVPRTVVLATDVFDHFMAENDLHDFAMRSGSDDRNRGAVPGFATLGRYPEPAARFPRESIVSPGRTFVQPAGRFAVPAILRRVRHLHAWEPRFATSKCACAS